MDSRKNIGLLGGLSTSQFMSRHWQKKPLLVRQAVPDMQALLSRQQLFALVSHDDVESRLVEQRGGAWKLRRGPFGPRSLPPLSRPQWSLLVQGTDLHDDRLHELLTRFRFVPDARLDDLMVSYATDGGGVGPHFDSYDVFLLQAHGKRRWRIGLQDDLTLRDDVPLKVLANFRPQQEWVLEPGDMLYLPPRYAHDGIAEGECMTYSIGFRAPARQELARELLQRIADEDGDEPVLYRDARQPAVESPAEIPQGMVDFARDSVARALGETGALERALGEYLTEPKANIWFDATRVPRKLVAVALDRRSRMMYDRKRIFINGESYLAAGRDATLMRKLADTRRLDAKTLAGASDDALELLSSWCAAGWLHAAGKPEEM
jgi:50S ribosomal protein L16 3-hydroxylase